ncbi:unnamed protein product, partial [Mesorhabditis belari]|uniref:Saposin B-type domain-containing protein n=1 Tax=Mesorhabditis belari TaxID=2138241 RepID=A0AAF3EH24_9BILA
MPLTFFETSSFDDTDNTHDYWQETSNANFSYVFLSELKSIQQKCLYNTLVLITNRLFNYKEGLLKDFPNLPDEYCTTFSVVLLGRPDISFKSFESRYGKFTTNLLQINNISCLTEITRCIPPCGDVPVRQCDTTITCSYPQPTTTPPLPITTSTAVSPCSMCEFVVNQGKFHFHQNESKRLVEMELLRDCESLRNLYGPQAVMDCDGWIRGNIDIVYKDLQNGKSAYQICVDMGECS